jgi:hypothetical protein
VPYSALVEVLEDHVVIAIARGLAKELERPLAS